MPKGFGIDPLFAAIIATMTPGKLNENLLGHYVSHGHGAGYDASKPMTKQQRRERKKRERQAKKKGRRA